MRVEGLCVSAVSDRWNYRRNRLHSSHSWGDRLMQPVSHALSCKSCTITSQKLIWFWAGFVLAGSAAVVVVSWWKTEGKREGGQEGEVGLTGGERRRRGWYSGHYVRLQTGPVWRGVLMWVLWAPGVRWPLIQPPIWSAFSLPLPFI